MKKLLIAAFIILPLLLGTTMAAEEQELKTSIVRIRGYEGVTPLNLFITPGTVVVWLNQDKSGPVEVKFPKKKVTLACKSPVNFKLNKEGTYVSNPIPYGAVASLCFIEQGTFDYYISGSKVKMGATTSDHFRFEGKIIVKVKSK